MKIKSLLICASCMLLASCGNPETPEKNKNFKIICPTGAPAVAFYNYGNNENFETNSVPSNIVSFMSETSPYDVVVIDTVSGLKAINNGAPYKIHSSITFGNFFIASTGHDEDEVMNEGDKIVLFGKNQTPDLIFHYIYGDTYNSSIEYVTAVSDAAACLASGKNVATDSDVDYVFVAQPVLFATLNNKDAKTYGKASVYANIQDAYKTKSGNKALVQASIFLKNKESNDYSEFLSSLEKDITDLVATPQKAVDALGEMDQTLVKSKYGILPNVMKAVLTNNNGLGLGFKKASENKENINNFISIFGMSAIKDEVIA